MPKKNDIDQWWYIYDYPKGDIRVQSFHQLRNDAVDSAHRGLAELRKTYSTEGQLDGGGIEVSAHATLFRVRIVEKSALVGRPISVTSSMIKQIGVDPKRGELCVMFTNGSSYRYEGVPEELFFQLLRESVSGGSIGKLFNGLIKGSYESRKTT